MMSLTFGLFTQVSGSGPLGPLVFFFFDCLLLSLFLNCRKFAECIQNPTLLSTLCCILKHIHYAIYCGKKMYRFLY